MSAEPTGTDLPIRCKCGALRGVLHEASGRGGNRCVCYCDDCQSFAHFLGRPEELLDAHGGTEVFQTSPALVEIAEGADRLACMRLTPKGLARWYTSCCRTPIGNTLATGSWPFVGLIRACIAADDSALESALGPIRQRSMGRFAIGDTSGLHVHERLPLSLIARIARMLVVWKLRGDRKRSPFFEPRTGAPAAVPQVLGDEELRELERAREGFRPQGR